MIPDRGNRKRFLVHRIVAIAYFGETTGMTVNHKNGIKNDNRVENLEWCTVGENNLHAQNSGFLLEGINNPRSNIDEEILLTLYTLCMSGFKNREDFSNTYKISKTGISRIFSGKNFKRIYKLIIGGDNFSLYLDRKRSDFKKSLKVGDKDKILNLRSNGATINSIKTETGHCAKTVRNTIARYGNPQRVDILYIS